MQHVPGLAHVPRHHHQQRGQSSHRQIAEKRCEDEYRQQHHSTVNNGRQWRKRSAAHVGGTAGDRRRGGNAAEQWCDQVAQALAQQFCIRIVFAAGHAIRHHRTQQGFDGPEHGNGERRCE
ncbi:hypothetical protein D9M71_785450 [compost metagenome]